MSDFFFPFPIVEYGNYAVRDITIKNKLSTELSRTDTGFFYYQIKDADRPDTLANLFYGDPELHWIILLANNIIDIDNAWPVADHILRQSIIDNFGEDGINEVLFYVDQNGEIVSARQRIDGVLTYPVTRYDVELSRNDMKRNIRIPKKELVNDIVAQHVKEIKRVGYPTF